MVKENYVRKAILADALELSPKIRKGDREEIMASEGISPLRALVMPFTYDNAKIYTIIGTVTNDNTLDTKIILATSSTVFLGEYKEPTRKFKIALGIEHCIKKTPAAKPDKLK